MSASDSSRLSPLAKTWLLCLIPILGWWTYGLFDLDEGFYAAVVGEMNRRSEWITPYYNGSPWFEKPILLYWLAKPCLLLFGQDWGPRMPSVLAFAGTIALVGWWCRRRFSVTTAKFSMIACASSLLVVALGRMMTADSILLLGVCAVFFCFWESVVGDMRWRYVAAAALGWTVLAKGPVICAVFIAVAIWTYWREPDFRPKFRGGWLTSTLIFLAVVATWYVPSYLVNKDDFVQEFLIRQNIGRFSGGDEAHRIPGILGYMFFVPVIALGIAPWSWWLKRAWPRGNNLDDAELRYLARWAIVVFVLFSISGSKLIHYILPALVPLCILVAHYLAGRQSQLPKWVYVPLAVISLMAVFGSPCYYYFWDPQRHVELRNIARELSSSPTPIVAYRFSRSNKADLGTGKMQLQDTSHPSLLFYLNRTVMELDDLITLPDRQEFWLVTRRNRLTELGEPLRDFDILPAQNLWIALPLVKSEHGLEIGSR